MTYRCAKLTQYRWAVMSSLFKCTTLGTSDEDVISCRVNILLFWERYTCFLYMLIVDQSHYRCGRYGDRGNVCYICHKTPDIPSHMSRFFDWEYHYQRSRRFEFSLKRFLRPTFWQTAVKKKEKSVLIDVKAIFLGAMIDFFSPWSFSVIS